MITKRGFRNTWVPVCYIFAVPATFNKSSMEQGNAE